MSECKEQIYFSFIMEFFSSAPEINIYVFMLIYSYMLLQVVINRSLC